ncbi:MAG: response regulator [Myxococcales bacterium]|nr:response regulator [Myxococcales bacterium]
MSEQVVFEPRYRILIVDDDDDVRDALLDELEIDYDVTAVATGAEALGRLDSERYDAIISDQRMPGMSGVQVLEEALRRDVDLVRILLTGFVDEDAHKATMQKNAPYKVGKPWHDEVEVTLKRAFEHRNRERSLSGSVTDALALAGIDSELAAVESPTALAKTLVRRVLSLEGVLGCAVKMQDEFDDKLLAGALPNSATESGSWNVDLPITFDGSIRLISHGQGNIARDIVDYLATRALHWNSEDTATRLAKTASDSQQAMEKLSAVTRRATLGTMTVALVHELASMVQGLQGALFELEDFVRDTATREKDPEVVDTLENAVEVSSRMVSLFRAMRTFVRSGDAIHRPCRIDSLVERSIALCRGNLRSVVTLDVADFPDEEVDVNEALFLQILVNLLKNAAEASPVGATVSIRVTVEDKRVLFSITDQGCGVPEELVNEIFEPFMSTKNEHTASGLGLAISSEIAHEHGGSIRYQATPEGGSTFTVSAPLVPKECRLSVCE